MYDPNLEAFLRVAEEGSFSKAGALLYISPSAVIQKINRLERELSVSLFERTNQGVRLTEAGTYLAQAAKEYIATGEKICADLSAIGNRRSTIYVGTGPFQKVQMIYDLWIMYAERESAREIRLVDLEKSLPDAEIVESSMDNSPWQTGWEFLKLCDVPIGCGITRHRVDEFGPELSFEQLKGWVIYSRIPRGAMGRDKIYRHLLNQGIEIRTVRDYDMDLQWQGACLPYAMLAPLCWQDALRDTVIIPFEGPITLPYGLFYRRELSPQAEDFLSFVRTLRDGGYPGFSLPNYSFAAAPIAPEEKKA